MDWNTVIVAVLASSGVWAVVQTITTYIIDKRKKKDESKSISPDAFNAVADGVRGLLYDHLKRECTEYVQRGYITPSELKDLQKYHYEPYHALKGDGTVDKLMARVEALDIREE